MNDSQVQFEEVEKIFRAANLENLDHQRTHSWVQIGATNLNLRPCMETKVSIIRTPKG